MDGFRALAFMQNGSCQLISRNGNAFGSFQVLTDAIAAELDCDAVLNGEIVYLDEHGRSQFNELLFRRGEPRFYAFDLLWCERKDLRFDGLHERKRKLRSICFRNEASGKADQISAQSDTNVDEASLVVDVHNRRLFTFVERERSLIRKGKAGHRCGMRKGEDHISSCIGQD